MEFIEERNDYDFLFKFMILGGSYTGKAYLANRLHFYKDYSKFIDWQKDIEPTIDVDFKLLYIKYKNNSIKITFWDSSGAGDVHSEIIVSSYMRGSNAFILCYDAYNRDSFNYIKNKYSEIKNDSNNSICVLIRNKYDIKANKDNNNIVSDEEALEFADANNIIFRHISSIEKYENGIIKLFELILDKVLDEEKKKPSIVYWID